MPKRGVHCNRREVSCANSVLTGGSRYLLRNSDFSKHTRGHRCRVNVSACCSVVEGIPHSRESRELYSPWTEKLASAPSLSRRKWLSTTETSKSVTIDKGGRRPIAHQASTQHYDGRQQHDIGYCADQRTMEAIFREAAPGSCYDACRSSRSLIKMSPARGTVPAWCPHFQR